MRPARALRGDGDHGVKLLAQRAELIHHAGILCGIGLLLLRGGRMTHAVDLAAVGLFCLGGPARLLLGLAAVHLLRLLLAQEVFDLVGVEEPGDAEEIGLLIRGHVAGIKLRAVIEQAREFGFGA